MNKLNFEIIEFYITNVCNFNCDNCNRLNNYHFSGHQRWADYQEVYYQWSQRIDFENITILGGEPTLNPDLDQWIIGLHKLWPSAKIEILSNGSRLKYWYDRGLFDLLAETQSDLAITLHNRQRRQSVISEVSSYMLDPVLAIDPNMLVLWADSYQNVKDPTWPDCSTYADFLKLPEHIKQECIDIHKIGFSDFLNDTGIVRLTDSRRFKVKISYAEDFYTAPLKYAGHDKFAVYHSDPTAAHDVCHSKWCTHMIKGKIYKCHHVALLPEFAQQFDVDMTEQQQELLLQYQPLTVDQDCGSMEKFLQEHVRNPIPQCSLCPSKLETVHLEASTNKPKIKKKVFAITPI
jgi:organic radical activating enzyme